LEDAREKFIQLCRGGLQISVGKPKNVKIPHYR
jgi:hypothetical protein